MVDIHFCIIIQLISFCYLTRKPEYTLYQVHLQDRTKFCTKTPNNFYHCFLPSAAGFVNGGSPARVPHAVLQENVSPVQNFSPLKTRRQRQSLSHSAPRPDPMISAPAVSQGGSIKHYKFEINS